LTIQNRDKEAGRKKPLKESDKNITIGKTRKSKDIAK
jgi:hypothetical protein